jgi:hypothetical protein
VFRFADRMATGARYCAFDPENQSLIDRDGSAYAFIEAANQTRNP